MFKDQKNVKLDIHVNNCRYEMKKLARLIDVEECDVEPNEIKSVFENKTLIKKINSCKPLIGVSNLFLCITIILIRIMNKK